MLWSILAKTTSWITAFLQGLPMADFKITVKGTDVFNCSSDNLILEAADEQGIDLPYGCRSGGCGACKCKLLSGEVDMGDAVALTDEEITDRYILTCICKPKSDLVIEPA